MRFRRTILLGLGPLLSLWAMTAHAACDTAARLMAESPGQQLTVEPLERLLHPVVSLFILASGQDVSDAHHTAPSPAILSLDALHSTAFRSSLYLVRGPIAVDLHARRNLHQIQRC
ncbi:MAG: hypothetical protein ABL995_11955 [Bryobacteraceae bacterium]